MRILVVEDAERLGRTVCRALRSSGWVVEEASDGEEGLWLAQSNAYDVIVLDVMLPKLDGLALLARLRAEGSAAHVLMLTARDTVADRVRGLSGGADDYLIKPFALEELLASDSSSGGSVRVGPPNACAFFPNPSGADGKGVAAGAGSGRPQDWSVGGQTCRPPGDRQGTG